jgi:hypothetical protein
VQCIISKFKFILFFCYPVYLSFDLENHNIGISIGNTYAGCPTCADDIVLLSLNNNEMQEMLDDQLLHPRTPNLLLDDIVYP